MKIVNRQVLAAALVAAALPITAPAHQGMHGPGSEFDIDGDGGLSLAEYRVYLKSTNQDEMLAGIRFVALDTNMDGVLSTAEFILGLRQKRE
jgi:hypothetical protein